jgi:hypothetical protein
MPRKAEQADGSGKPIAVTRAMLEHELAASACVVCRKPLKIGSLVRTAKMQDGKLQAMHLRCEPDAKIYIPTDHSELEE